MNIISKHYKILFYLIFLAGSTIFYICHHSNVIQKREFKFYNNMILSLQYNDIVSTKYYVKKILKINRSSIYCKIAFLVLYNLEKREKKFDSYIFKNKFFKNRNSIFKNL